MHPDLLPHVTPIVLSALTSPEIALYATMALKDMRYPAYLTEFTVRVRKMLSR